MSQLRYIKPYDSQILDLDLNAMNSTLDIPAHLLNKNLIIEISNKLEGLTETKQYFCSGMKTRIVEKYGQMNVFKPCEEGSN